MDEASKSRVFLQTGGTRKWAHTLGAFRAAKAWSRPPASALGDLLARTVAACGGSSGSVFLLEPGGKWLREALGRWDWTRTSFRVWLEHWPNVFSALRADRAMHLGLHRSHGAEADWFERNGIQGCIAAPMVGRRGPVGVLFVDYTDWRGVHLPSSLVRAHQVAKDWAHAIEAACDFELRTTEPGAARCDSAPHPDTPVRMVMTLSPVCIGVHAVAHAAARLAQTRGVHHLLAIEAEMLRGILCECDLDAARGDAIVSEMMHSPVVSVAADATLAHAAGLMREQAVGCLPVLSASGHMVGVVTRRDLRRVGAFAREPGLDARAACGNTHDLSPQRRPAPSFCLECAFPPPLSESSVEARYQTLGGSG